MRWISTVIVISAIGGLVFCDIKKLQEIKIMTFNIRYGTADDGDNAWENRKSILIDCLKRCTPDILGTQESLPFQIDTIKAAFPQWEFFGVGRYHNVEVPYRPQENKEGESCGVFYDTTKFKLLSQGTFWHSDTPDIPGSITWGNSLPRILTWGIFQIKHSDKEFVIMNTHLHGGEPYISKTTKLIMRKWCQIAGSRPTILMGDFNLLPTSEFHKLFCGGKRPADLRGKFIDCWEVLDKPETGSGTAHSFAGVKDRSRIDWILATHEFKVKNIEIIYDNVNGRYPSDHFPVVVELQL